MKSPKDDVTQTREQLLPDIVNALSDVSRYAARTLEEADASRQGKPRAPSVDDITKYCEWQQKKIDLLKAEVTLMKAAEDAGTKGKAKDQKVRWTDIDGNVATDAAWLN